MSLTSYSDLLQAVSEWPALQGEQDLAGAAATIVSLGEASINRDLHLQGHIETLVVPGTELSEYVLPDDLTKIDRVEDAGGYAMEQRPADELRRGTIFYWSGTVYAVDGRRLLFSIPQDGFTLRYFKRLPPLSTVSTHWLFQAAPDLYLFSSLIQAGIYAKEPPQEYERYRDAYMSIVQQMKREDWDSQAAQSQPLRALMGRKGRNLRTT